MSKKSKLIGREYTNNEGSSGTIIDSITPSDPRSKVSYTTMVTIKFDSGYIGDYDIRNVRKGVFKDYGVPNSVGGYVYPREKNSFNERVYNLWNHMMHRCYNPKTHNYKDYGGRGVVVADRWHYLENFEEDIKEIEGYNEWISNPEYSLDKDIKFKGNLIYSKETCVFADKKNQVINRRGTHPIRVIRISDGSLKVYSSQNEASRETGVHRANIYKVLKGTISQSGGYKFEIVI